MEITPGLGSAATEISCTGRRLLALVANYTKQSSGLRVVLRIVGINSPYHPSTNAPQNCSLALRAEGLRNDS